MNLVSQQATINAQQIVQGAATGYACAELDAPASTYDRIRGEFDFAEDGSMDRTMALLDAQWEGEKAARRGEYQIPKEFDGCLALQAMWFKGNAAEASEN